MKFFLLFSVITLMDSTSDILAGSLANTLFIQGCPGSFTFLRETSLVNVTQVFHIVLALLPAIVNRMQESFKTVGQVLLIFQG